MIGQFDDLHASSEMPETMILIVIPWEYFTIE